MSAQPIFNQPVHPLQKKKPNLKLVPFSKKQKSLMCWWHPLSPVIDYRGIIADGSIRAGKTFPMSLSFVEWAFHYFEEENFIMCGKTVGSFRRNVLLGPKGLKRMLKKMSYEVTEKRSENLLIVSKGTKTNYFYVFGGRDESSQDLVQGITAAGLYCDEVALMPESFVNQATGRCSVEGAKIWFNCNPDSPTHWFKEKWLDEAKKKKLLYLHFTQEDNPSLTAERKEFYRSLYTGVFFKRFILGLWVVAEGAIYDMWSDELNTYTKQLPQRKLDLCRKYITIDYGTQNPMAFLYILDDGINIYIDKEYYYDGRKAGIQKTDHQYGEDFDKFATGLDCEQVIIDPSAASFIAELKNRGYRVKQADNEVEDGIRLTSTLIGRRIIQVNKKCINLIKEMGAYVWDTKKTDKGTEQPVKANDHCLDALRYWCKTKFKPRRLAPEGDKGETGENYGFGF